MTAKMKSWLVALLTVAVIGAFTVRAFFPGQPIHHELNEAAAVLLVSLLLVWWLA